MSENRIQGEMTVQQVTSPKLQLNKICLIDADFIKHVAHSRAAKIIEKEWIEDLPTMKKVIRAEAVGMCDDIAFKIRDPLIFCFSAKSSNTFRYKIALEKEYKGNRKNDNLTLEELKIKLALMDEALEAIVNEKVCLIFEDLEADDILSMLQDEHTYIYSRDKDLKQIPGLHYDEQTNEVTMVTPEAAYRFLALQMITGDTTDNITGIKGIGPKNAEKILSQVSDRNVFNAVYREYKKKYGIVKGTDLFCQNWLLIKLRMCHGDYFCKKYESAFSLVENIKKNILNLKP